MKNNVLRSGSLVLIILIVMTAFIVIVHSMAHTSAYLALLAQKRGHRENK